MGGEALPTEVFAPSGGRRASLSCELGEMKNPAVIVHANHKS